MNIPMKIRGIFIFLKIYLYIHEKYAMILSDGAVS